MPFFTAKIKQSKTNQWIVFLKLLVVGVLAQFAIAQTTTAQQAPRVEETIVVATHDVERMSFDRKDGYRDGRDIRVARYVLKNLGYDKDSIEFKVVDVDDKFSSVTNGDARFYIGAATLTAAREKLGDFSVPHLSVPFGVVVRVEKSTWIEQLISVLKRTIGWLIHPTFWVIVVALLIYLRFKALAVAIVEKVETKNPMPFWKLFKKTVWWVECTFCNFNADSKDYVPSGHFARRVATGLTILLVIVGVNYIHEGMSMVMHQYPDTPTTDFDFSDKHVGVKAKTTSVEFSHEMGASIERFPTIEEALTALNKGTIDAVVYDAVTLKALVAKQKPSTGHELVYAAEYGSQNYGAFFNDGDPLIEQWNQAVLNIPAPLTAEWDRHFLRQ
ncbi:MAG: transporter substrate-binding domain-containing protein [Opitutaceae bacterium]